MLLRFTDLNLFLFCKLHIFWKDHKNVRNLHLRFVLCSNNQIYDGDFEDFCGLLRIYLWTLQLFSLLLGYWRDESAYKSSFWCNINDKNFSAMHSRRGKLTYFPSYKIVLGKWGRYLSVKKIDEKKSQNSFKLGKFSKF